MKRISFEVLVLKGLEDLVGLHRTICRTFIEMFQMLKLDLKKAEEPEIELPTSTGLSKQQESSRKTSISALLTDYIKVFNCVDHNKLWKILNEMGISDHLICLLRNLYTGQEATVRAGHGATD